MSSGPINIHTVARLKKVGPLKRLNTIWNIGN